jgi:hypothetical protein
MPSFAGRTSALNMEAAASPETLINICYKTSKIKVNLRALECFSQVVQQNEVKSLPYPSAKAYSIKEEYIEKFLKKKE